MTIPHHYTALGLFNGVEKVTKAVDPIRRQFEIEDGEISLLSSCSLPENAIVEDRRPYPIHYLVWALGLAGFAIGVAIAGGTGYIMNLNVGNKPTFALPPVAVITYEFTLLFSVIGAVAGFLAFAGFPDWRKRAYHQDISEGALGLLVKVYSEEDRDAAARLMEQLGAYLVETGENDY
jgi:hypothetical protein